MLLERLWLPIDVLHHRPRQRCVLEEVKEPKVESYLQCRSWASRCLFVVFELNSWWKMRRLDFHLVL
jgi:hypothetical protein